MLQFMKFSARQPSMNLNRFTTRPPHVLSGDQTSQDVVAPPMSSSVIRPSATVQCLILSIISTRYYEQLRSRLLLFFIMTDRQIKLFTSNAFDIASLCQNEYAPLTSDNVAFDWRQTPKCSNSRPLGANSRLRLLAPRQIIFKISLALALAGRRSPLCTTPLLGLFLCLSVSV